jgi:hypothetical protein
MVRHCLPDIVRRGRARAVLTLLGGGLFIRTNRPLAASSGAAAPSSRDQDPARAQGLDAEPAGSVEVGRFSALPLGLDWTDPAGRHAGWQRQTVASIAPNRFSIRRELVDGADQPQDSRTTRPVSSESSVLRIDVDQSAAALVHRFAAGPQRVQRLSWRWRADGFPPGEPGVRARDDFAARLYLMFDYPLARVPVAQRWLLRAARVMHDPALPAATLVYLLHDRPVGPGPIDSPYSSRVRMLLPRPQAQAGRWYQESRDLAADFQAAFGAEYGAGLPPIEAIAVGADGDQTGARFSAWFGDLVATAG